MRKDYLNLWLKAIASFTIGIFLLQHTVLASDANSGSDSYNYSSGNTDYQPSSESTNYSPDVQSYSESYTSYYTPPVINNYNYTPNTYNYTPPTNYTLPTNFKFKAPTYSTPPQIQSTYSPSTQAPSINTRAPTSNITTYSQSMQSSLTYTPSIHSSTSLLNPSMNHIQDKTQEILRKSNSTLTKTQYKNSDFTPPSRRQISFSPYSDSKEGDGEAWVFNSKGQPDLVVSSQDNIHYEFKWDKDLSGEQKMTLIEINPEGQQEIKNYIASFDNNGLLKEVRIPQTPLSNGLSEINSAPTDSQNPEQKLETLVFKNIMRSDEELLGKFNSFSQAKNKERDLGLPPFEYSDSRDLIVDYSDAIIEYDEETMTINYPDKKIKHTYSRDKIDMSLTWLNSQIEKEKIEPDKSVFHKGDFKVTLEKTGNEEDEVISRYRPTEEGLYKLVTYEQRTPEDRLLKTGKFESLKWVDYNGVVGDIFKIQSQDWKSEYKGIQEYEIKTSKIDNSLITEIYKKAIFDPRISQTVYKQASTYDSAGNQIDITKTKKGGWQNAPEIIVDENNDADPDIDNEEIFSSIILTVPPLENISQD